MTLTKSYVCQNCGASFSKWMGRCQNCSSWNSFSEELRSSQFQSKTTTVPAKAFPISDIKSQTDCPRIPSGFGELDRLLGGGVLPGSFVLIGGEPGIGKSTLLLQVSHFLAQNFQKVLYVSGEESVYQIKDRAQRLAVSDNPNLFVVSETDLNAIVSCVETMKPKFVVVDSIQIMHHSEYSSSPGTINQVRECSSALMLIAKRLNISIFVVGHVNKEGLLAGPKVLEHIVDTVLYFEGDAHRSYRMVRSVKNRFGSANESAVFEMKKGGLFEVLNPSDLFLSDRRLQTPGSVVVPCVDGSRSMLLEIQALLSQSYQQNYPKRVSTFMDHNRLVLLIAIIERHLKISLSHKDVFVHLLGGIKRSDASFDLGIILAMLSSLKDRPLISSVTVMGELGLGGEIRSVSQIDRCIMESERLGFSCCLIPEGASAQLSEQFSIELIEVKDLHEAVEKGLSA